MTLERRKVAAAFATQPVAASAANAMLPRGNAVDAVCAGAFAAAAESPGVLFGPVHLLVAGPGLGLRAIDGRLAQPGAGVPRPRGFVSEKEVPAAARFAVPAMPAALATALTMFGSATLRRAMGPALDVARAANPGRFALLDAISKRGAFALAEDRFLGALVAAAGALAGGIFSKEDLGALKIDVAATAQHDGWAGAPFFDPEAEGGERCHVVCAADGRGIVAALGYELEEEGLAIDELGIVAPLRGLPVMRGERRTSPGTILPAPSSIALLGKGEGALGLGAQPRAASRLAAAMADHARGAPLDQVLRARAPSAAALRSPRGASGYSFTP